MTDPNLIKALEEIAENISALSWFGCSIAVILFVIMCSIKIK